MSEGYNFVTQVLQGSVSSEKLATATTVGSVILAAIVVLFFGLKAVSSLNNSSNKIIPESKLNTRNFFELIAELIFWMGDTAMGKENRKYLPFAASLFIFVLCMNLMGLVPGFVMPTHSVSVNAALAVLVFVLYHAWGIKEVGIINFLKHMCFYDALRPVSIFLFLILGSFLFVLEVISGFIRPLSLTLRLFGNMNGDHIVLGVFTELTRNIYVPIPVIFYCLGTIICLIQAFVFTLLTMIYIRLAVSHGEGAHAEENHH